MSNLLSPRALQKPRPIRVLLTNEIASKRTCFAPFREFARFSQRPREPPNCREHASRGFIASRQNLENQGSGLLGSRRGAATAANAIQRTSSAKSIYICRCLGFPPDKRACMMQRPEWWVFPTLGRISGEQPLRGHSVFCGGAAIKHQTAIDSPYPAAVALASPTPPTLGAARSPPTEYADLAKERIHANVSRGDDKRQASSIRPPRHPAVTVGLPNSAVAQASSPPGSTVTFGRTRLPTRSIHCGRLSRLSRYIICPHERAIGRSTQFRSPAQVLRSRKLEHCVPCHSCSRGMSTYRSCRLSCRSCSPLSCRKSLTSSCDYIRSSISSCALPLQRRSSRIGASSLQTTVLHRCRPNCLPPRCTHQLLVKSITSTSRALANRTCSLRRRSMICP